MESTEQEVDDEDFHQDIAEVTDFVNAHRGQEGLPEGSAGPGGECFSPVILKHLERTRTLSHFEVSCFAVVLHSMICINGLLNYAPCVRGICQHDLPVALVGACFAHGSVIFHTCMSSKVKHCRDVCHALLGPVQCQRDLLHSIY